LTTLTDYKARAYVTNQVGTVYGDIISFCTFDSVVDADGNVYYGVKIGDQVWLTENLKTTHFNNGDAIPYAPDDAQWSSMSGPAYCWYDNDESRADKGFGALYNLKVITDSRGIAPAGYRVPSKEDIMTFGNHFGLEQYVTDEHGDPYQYIYKGGKSIRSNKYWAPIMRGNNSTGFSAIPNGFRFRDGSFLCISIYATWWTTTRIDEEYFWTFYTGGEINNDHLILICNPQDSGMGIRCVKEN